ncbi:Nn.00g068060.m01.CDS01 [Neocucurbitaria sp. VM-36]
MWHARDIVSLIELLFYVPTSLLALIVCFRHGFHRSSGWLYTLILCTVRIAGAICQFLSHSNHSDGLIQATVIIDSIGLSPLLLATLGLLSRLVSFVNVKSTPTITLKHFRILQLLITVGLILSIVGGTSGNIQPNGTVQVDTTSKAGIILLIVAYAGLVLIYFISASKVSIVPNKERRVSVAIFCALPLILVRLVYSACAVFLHSHLFSIVTGSVVVHVVMAIIEEFIVVAIYILLGFLVDKLDNSKQGVVSAQRSIGGRDRTYTTGDLEAQGSMMEGHQRPLSPSPVHHQAMTG